MPMTDSLFALLDKDGENRTAFLAALIMDRCRVKPEDAAPVTDLVPAPSYYPAHAERIACTLVKLARSIKRHAENECNREVTDAEIKRDEATQARFHTIAKEIGMEARTGGDPRGACAYLIDPNDRSAGDGWCNGFAVYS